MKKSTALRLLLLVGLLGAAAALSVYAAQLRFQLDQGPFPRLPGRLVDRYVSGDGDVRLPRLAGSPGRRPDERQDRGRAGTAGVVLRRLGGDRGGDGLRYQ